MSNQKSSNTIELAQAVSNNSVSLPPYHFANLDGVPGNNYIVVATNEDAAYPATVEINNGSAKPTQYTIPVGQSVSMQIHPLNPTGKVQVTNISDEPVAGRPLVKFDMTAS